MGRRKPAAAFSLFSFQDIITSVTAILILVMILLTIELVTRQRHQATNSPDATRRHIDATVTRLESIASRLRNEVAARRAQQTPHTLQEARDVLAATQANLTDARLRLAETQRTRNAVARLLATAEEEAATHAADAERLAKLQRQSDEDCEECDRLESANRTEQERQENRKREIAEKPRSGTELVFNPPADSDRKAWLVELSGDGATVVLLGGNRTQRLGADTDAGSATEGWIAGLKPEGDYCLLLVRPSAAKGLGRDIEQRLNDAGIRFGIDLIGEDQAVRDGSTTKNRAP
ncbi:MAG: hypothetical protein K8S94_00155 [Planctomycetia bacterium]|nr:hypothetical protein [Planctomycetia bacterium]